MHHSCYVAVPIFPCPHHGVSSLTIYGQPKHFTPTDKALHPQVRLKQDGEKGCYFENRLGCGSSNPYLVMAATVAAGLDGLRNQIEPPPPDSTDKCLELPKNVDEAMDVLEKDEYLAAELGLEFCKWFRLVKEAEMRSVGHSLGDQVKQELKVYSRFL
eukprot:scaffold185900_cov34-Prasinocladus_malaysianus.AAC.1